jgi:hypothetical protein
LSLHRADAEPSSRTSVVQPISARSITPGQPIDTGSATAGAGRAWRARLLSGLLSGSPQRWIAR